MHGSERCHWFSFTAIATDAMCHMPVFSGAPIKSEKLDSLCNFLLDEQKINGLNHNIQAVTKGRPNNVSQAFHLAVDECFGHFCDRSFKNTLGNKKLFKILPSFAVSWAKKRFLILNNSALKTQFIETWDAMIFRTINGRAYHASGWSKDFVSELLHKGDYEKFDYVKDPENAIVQKAAQLIESTPRLGSYTDHLVYTHALPVCTFTGLLNPFSIFKNDVLQPGG